MPNLIIENDQMNRSSNAIRAKKLFEEGMKLLAGCLELGLAEAFWRSSSSPDNVIEGH